MAYTTNRQGSYKAQTRKDRSDQIYNCRLPNNQQIVGFTCYREDTHLCIVTPSRSIYKWTEDHRRKARKEANHGVAEFHERSLTDKQHKAARFWLSMQTRRRPSRETISAPLGRCHGWGVLHHQQLLIGKDNGGQSKDDACVPKSWTGPVTGGVFDQERQDTRDVNRTAP